MRRIKVAFCTDGIYPLALGGMQKHSRLLIEELSSSSKVELSVIHPHRDKVFSGSINEIHIQGIDETKIYLWQSLLYSKRVYQVLRELNPDVIYSQGLSVWYNASEIGEKLVVNPHGLEPFQGLGYKDRLLGYPFRRVFNYLFKNAAVTISLGGKLNDILRTRAARMVEIPNAAHIASGNERRLTGDGRVRVLFLGRFVHNKGIDILFKAISQLAEVGSLEHFEFTIAGAGPLYQHYKSLNNFHNVHLPGLVPDQELARLYRSHDLFVLPTLFEGMPTVVLEAMSYGLAVIVSDVGATSVVVDSNTGRLVRPGSLDDLVNAFKWFLSLSAAEKDNISKAAVERFHQNFTWREVAYKHIELFETMVNCKS